MSTLNTRCYIYTLEEKKTTKLIITKSQHDLGNQIEKEPQNSTIKPKPQTLDIRITCTYSDRPIRNPSLDTILIHFLLIEPTPSTSTNIMNPMLHLLRSPRYLPAGVLAALAERVSRTYPALISKADEPITWVAFVIWAACIAVRVVVVDFQSHTIFVALRASWGLNSGDRHRCSRDMLGLP